MIPSKLRILNSRLRSDRDSESQTLPADASQTEFSSCGEKSQTKPRIINVLICGEPGVGKSSVINLIARTEIAPVSSNVLVNGCTMQYNRYPVSFDDMNLALFDTIGLEESQMGVNSYLGAIERAYELVSKLDTTGGIHLLLFCMRGGKTTATTLSNYRLFCECLCHTEVPMALVFTGLERETKMEDWWDRNKKRIEDYGIKSDDHACITAIQNNSPGEYHNYQESEERIREVLKNCAHKNAGFSPESHPWLARVMRGMKDLVVGKKSPKTKDIMKILTHRCKLDLESAKKIITMMENGEADNREREGEKDGSISQPEGTVQGGGHGKDTSQDKHDDQNPPDAVPNKVEDAMGSNICLNGGKLVVHTGRDGDQTVTSLSDSNAKGTVQGAGGGKYTLPDKQDDRDAPDAVPNKVGDVMRSDVGLDCGRPMAQSRRDGDQAVNPLSNVESTVDGGDTLPNKHDVQAAPDVVPNKVGNVTRSTAGRIRGKPEGQSGRDGDRQAVNPVRGGRGRADTLDKQNVQAAPGVVPNEITSSTLAHIGPLKPVAQSGNDGDRAPATGARATTKLSAENGNFTIFFFALVCAGCAGILLFLIKAQGSKF